MFFFNRDKNISNHIDESMEDRFLRTQRVMDKIKSSGKYTVYEIWGCEFAREYKTNNVMRDYIENHELLHNKPLDPRDALYGGCTENYVKIRDVGPGEKKNIWT